MASAPRVCSCCGQPIAEDDLAVDYVPPDLVAELANAVAPGEGTTLGARVTASMRAAFTLPAIVGGDPSAHQDWGRPGRCVPKVHS